MMRSNSFSFFLTIFFALSVSQAIAQRDDSYKIRLFKKARKTVSVDSTYRLCIKFDANIKDSIEVHIYFREKGCLRKKPDDNLPIKITSDFEVTYKPTVDGYLVFIYKDSTKRIRPDKVDVDNCCTVPSIKTVRTGIRIQSSGAGSPGVSTTVDSK